VHCRGPQPPPAIKQSVGGSAIGCHFPFVILQPAIHPAEAPVRPKPFSIVRVLPYSQDQGVAAVNLKRLLLILAGLLGFAVGFVTALHAQDESRPFDMHRSSRFSARFAEDSYAARFGR
jgi:hypothetical protein